VIVIPQDVFGLNSQERSSLTRRGFAISRQLDAPDFNDDDGFVFGSASGSLSAGQNSLFTSTTQPLVSGQTFASLSVVRGQSTTMLSSFNGGAGLPFTWGIWDASSSYPAFYYPNSNQANSSIIEQEITNSVIVANFTPTPRQNLSGSRFFEVGEISGNLLTSYSGDSEAKGSFDFDLENGIINDFYIDVCLGGSGCSSPADLWEMDPVSGIEVLSDGLVFDVEVTGFLNGSSPFEGEVNAGFISGTSEETSIGFVEALIAGFRFVETNSEPMEINGAVLFTAGNSLGVAEASAANAGGQIGFGIFSAISEDFNDEMGIFGTAGNTDSTRPFIIHNISDSNDDSPVNPIDTNYDLLRGQNSVIGGYWPDVADYNESPLNGLNWGLWLTAGEGVGGNESPLLLDNAGNGSPGIARYLQEDNPAFVWFSVGGATATSYFNNYTGFKRFEANNTNSNFQMRSSNADWTVFEFVAQFEIDLQNGALIGGLSINVCEVDCSTGLRQEWIASFDGGETGTLSTSLGNRGFSVGLNATVQLPGDPSQFSRSGLFQGYFAGESGNSFSAGFNLGGEGSGPANSFVSGLILFNALDKLNEFDLQAITDSADGDAAFAFAISNSDFFTTELSNNLVWGWTDADLDSNSPLLLSNLLSGSSTLTAGQNAFGSGGVGINFDTALHYFDDDSTQFDDDIGEGFQLLWGFWESNVGGSEANLIDAYDEASILNDFLDFDISGMNLLVTGVPASQVSVLSGTVDFTQTIGQIGGRLGDSVFTEIDVIEGIFQIDFSTGAIDITKFDVCFNGEGTCGGEKWSVDTGGGLSLTSPAGKGILEKTPVTGSSTSSSADPEAGSFSGFINGFAPASDDEVVGFVLGFNFNASYSTDPSEEVIGAGLFLGVPAVAYPLGVGSGDFTTTGLLVTGSSDASGNRTLSGTYGGPAIPNASGMPVIAARSIIGSSTFTTPFDTGTDSLLRLNDGTPSGFSAVSDDVTWGKWAGTTSTFEKRSEVSSAFFDQNAYWFLADPAAVTTATGTYRYEDSGTPGDNILAFQGEYNVSVAGDTASEYAIMSIDKFKFDINFANGIITNGEFAATTANDITWDVALSGNLATVGQPYIDLTVLSGTLTNTDVPSAPVPLNGAVSGGFSGYFVGDTNPDIALGFTLSNTTADSDEDHVLVGTLLASGNRTLLSPLTLPDSTVETHAIDWGTWNNPIEDNWVVVNSVADGVELQTSNHLAIINPTPVANLTGTGSYGSTAASSFIGSGSAGDVTQVVAGMNVDFNTGAITDGSLQVAVGGSQTWEIDFAGSINNGFVDLNAISGTLSDPGGVLSNSIQANLGGVFTGIGAEAFVGGFDLVDQLNQFNEVDGLYTIER